MVEMGTGICLLTDRGYVYCQVYCS